MEDVSLTVNPLGDCRLLGPNGAGKTTPPLYGRRYQSCDAGNIIIDDEDISSVPAAHRARAAVGPISAAGVLFSAVSAYLDNPMAVLQIRDLTANSERRPRQRADGRVSYAICATAWDRRCPVANAVV